MLFVEPSSLRTHQPPDQLSKKQEGLRSFRHACWDCALGQHARLRLAESVQSRVMGFPSLCHDPLDEIGNYPQHGQKDWLPPPHPSPKSGFWDCEGRTLSLKVMGEVQHVAGAVGYLLACVIQGSGCQG